MSQRKDAASVGRGPTFVTGRLQPLTPERVQLLLGDRYTVIREIGAGGTSIVYLAQDAVRGQAIAVKVLRPELSAAVVAARFLREIEIGQRLDHPNVLKIHELGSADGELYCTMPFIDGETLRQRLGREQSLSIVDTLRISRAVADALDHAHRLDIIHRDIKPANVLLDGERVVVADFGMARAMTAAASGDLTETGLVVGTATYMSPEQGSAAETLDGRTDVYSLACVVYEMLAGESPFTGPTPQAIILRHCQEAPRSLRIIRPSVPAGMQRAIEKALAKVPADRFATAGEFVDALEAGAKEQSLDAPVLTPSATPETKRLARIALPWIAAGVVAVTAFAAGAGWWRAANTSPPEPIRFTVEPPDGLSISNGQTGIPIGLSRDGKSLVFLAAPGDRVYLRRLDQLAAIPFPKVSQASDFHFSRDGKSLAYTNTGRSGGATTISIGPGDVAAEPRKVVNAPGWNGISWTYSSDIVQSWDNTLWRIPAAGGTPRKIASMDSLDSQWRQPTMLSDGKTIAFRVTPRGATSADDDRLALISIDGVKKRTLLDLKSQGAVGYVDGILIFSGVQGRIMAVKFDLGRRQQRGEPVVLLDAVAMKSNAGAVAALSDNGTLAYLVGKPAAMVQIVDEPGTVTAELPQLRQYSQTVWSPDGKRIAMSIMGADETPDIWVYDVDSRVLTRLTQTGGFWPAWTPDGKRIGFIGWGTEGMTGGSAMWVAADGSSLPEPIPGASALGSLIRVVTFSPDGKYAVLRRQTRRNEPAGTGTAFAVPLAGGAPVPIVVGTPRPNNLRVSPNGKWIAYSSDESGSEEVYVRPFPGGTGRIQVSSNGGVVPRWTGDGKKLFYRSGEKSFHAATLDLIGPRPHVVRSDSLSFNRSSTDRPVSSYDIHPDGKHFVVTRDMGTRTIVVVTNWMTEVRAKLAGM